MSSIFGTGNPVLNDQTFSTVGPWGNMGRRAEPGTMTVQGAALNSLILVGVVGIVATLV